MDEKTIIFSSVLGHFIESLTPHGHSLLLEFNKQLENPGISPEEVLLQLFKRFPRSIPSYDKVISNLTDLAGASPVESLHFLTKQLKKLINKGPENTPFSILSSLSALYDRNNKYMREGFHFFTVLFTTDLICQIVARYGAQGAVTFLLLTGQTVSSCKIFQSGLLEILLKEWSVIFSLVSETELVSVLPMFGSHYGYSDPTTRFTLLRFLRLDKDPTLGAFFFEDVIEVLKQHVRKKTVTNGMLEAVSFMLITLPYSEETFQKLFSLIWPLRKDKIVWAGAAPVIASIIIRMPKLWKDGWKFLQKKVLTFGSDMAKLKVAMRCWPVITLGSDVNPTLLFWEWGPNTRISPIEYVKYIGPLPRDPTNSSSEVALFMTNFFPKADFSEARKGFTCSIIHIMSLDFQYFIDNIMNRFLSLPENDSRFLVLLGTVPIVNSSDFSKFAIKAVTPEQIKMFNQLVKPKVLSALRNYPIDHTKHSISIADSDFFMTSIINEADQKVGSILEEWKVDKFGEVRVRQKKAAQYEDHFTLIGQLLPTIEYLFGEEEYSDKQILTTLVNLTTHSSNHVSSNARSICEGLLSVKAPTQTYVEVLVANLTSVKSPESMTATVSLLAALVKNGRSDLITGELALEIEAVCIASLSSIFPVTRSLTVEFLNELNNTALKGRGAMSFISPLIPKIEKNVRKKVLLHVIPNKPEILSVSATRISFEHAIITHYFEIWLFFLAEIMNVLIASNYVPFFERVSPKKDLLLQFCTGESTEKQASDVSALIIVLSSQFYFPGIKPTLGEPPLLYAEFAPRDDNRSFVCKIIHHLVSSDDERLAKLGFTAVCHIHYSLFSGLIDVLATVPKNCVADAAWTMCLMLRQPELTVEFFHHNISRIISFLTFLQYHLAEMGANSPRIMQWNDETELELIKHWTIARDYCIIVHQSFSSVHHLIPESVWPLSSRGVLFRFLVNWAITKSPRLESLRRYAVYALVTVVGVGRFFRDAVLFDDGAVKFFGDMDGGMAVLGNLIHNQVDVLLDTFIRACYTQQAFVADRYFFSIVETIISLPDRYIEFIYSKSGELLLLGMIFAIRKHPRARELLQSLAKIISSCNTGIEIPNIDDITCVPPAFAFAVEAVFDAFFRIFELKDLHVMVKDVIEAVKPWVMHIRLLPNQKTCGTSVAEEFNFFTPYQFLVKLMETTEAFKDDEIRLIRWIWIDLLHSPDHKTLVPIFISRWPKNRVKQKLLMMLIDKEPEIIAPMMVARCQFGFYYFITQEKHIDWSLVMWVCPVMDFLFHRHWDIALPYLASCLHFALLVAGDGTNMMFIQIAKGLSVDVPDENMRADIKRDVVDQLIRKLTDKDLEVWGNEALKWLFGSDNLEYAYNSLLIYNRIRKPFEPNVITGVIQAVTYHLEHVKEDKCKEISDLVTESFIFFTNVLEGNELIAFNFVACFLDCRIFVETSLKHAASILVAGLENPQIFGQAWISPISIVRPLISNLESNTQFQVVMNECIRYSQSPELMMIVIPIKRVSPKLFPDALDMVSTANETTLCQALVLYSLLALHVSIPVLNNIFDICAMIVAKTIDETNTTTLARLYQLALRYITRCPAALDFVKVICEKQPNIARVTVLDVYEWDRTIEDVLRSISHLNVKDETPAVTITDCHSYANVMKFREATVRPKILPFASNSEIIAHMMEVKIEKKKSRKTRSRRDPSISGFGMISSMSVVFQDDEKTLEMSSQIGPLGHPKRLIFAPEMFEMEDHTHRITGAEFVAGRRRSSVVFVK